MDTSVSRRGAPRIPGPYQLEAPRPRGHRLRLDVRFQVRVSINSTIHTINSPFSPAGPQCPNHAPPKHDTHTHTHTHVSVKLLLESGANCKKTNSDGLTALQLAQSDLLSSREATKGVYFFSLSLSLPLSLARARRVTSCRPAKPSKVSTHTHTHTHTHTNTHRVCYI